MKYNSSCCFCHKQIFKKPYQIKKYTNNCCNRMCMGLYNKRQKTIECSHCSKKVKKNMSSIIKNKNNFCSRSCATSYKNSKVFYKHGNSNYRNKALSFFGSKCQNPKCEINIKKIKLKPELLDVDHINENRNDSRLENLQVLCLLCHALKSRMKIKIIRKKFKGK